jgi:hypothetical protein
MKSAVAHVCSVIVGLATFLVVITPPKPYHPSGPDPDADSPIGPLPYLRVQLPTPPSAPTPVITPEIPASGVQHCKARCDVIFNKLDDHTMTFHMELTTHCDGLADKTYISRQATVDVAKDPSGEVGAALVVAMANELVKYAGEDGYEVTPKALLQNSNLVRE